MAMDDLTCRVVRAVQPRPCPPVRQSPLSAVEAEHGREGEVLGVASLDPELVEARLHRRRRPEARVGYALAVDGQVEAVLERAAERGPRDLRARLGAAEERESPISG